AEGLPVGVGGQRAQPGQGGHRRPVGQAVDPADQRQQADGGGRPLGGAVADQVGDEVDQAVLAEGQHLGGQLGRHGGPAVALGEAGLAGAAAGAPAGTGGGGV